MASIDKSPPVRLDAGSVEVGEIGASIGSTATDGSPDVGLVDLGRHQRP